MSHYYWFGLKSVPYVGNVTFCKLLQRFGTPERALAASGEELSPLPWLNPQAVQGILSGEWRRAADLECAALESSGARIVDFLSEDYPKSLMEISDYPPYLYVKGELSPCDPAVAVVGSRRASHMGLSTAEKMSRELAQRGVAVISGMARGIDTAAHRGALQGGGRTLAVLGCGIDVIYPAENAPLHRRIAGSGAVISEFPLGTKPLAENFPRRNRIISGLSRGVLVVEAAEGSGSLITAEYALEQGRDVFAVPGYIGFTGSRGTNRLIKEGATLVESVEDIIGQLPAMGGSGVEKGGAPPAFSLTPQEAAVYAALAPAPLHIDDILVKCELTVGEVSAILLRLELKGAVVQLPGKHFSTA